MAKFQKSKFRNGQRISNDAKWTEVDMRSAGVGYRRARRKSGRGILSKAIGNAVRQSVREALKPQKTTTYKTATARTRPMVKDAQCRTTLAISEMPEELRYLSYPHLKPKPKAKPVPQKKQFEQKAIERVERDRGSYWELLEIIRLFVLDILGKSKTKP